MWRSPESGAQRGSEEISTPGRSFRRLRRSFACSAVTARRPETGRIGTHCKAFGGEFYGLLIDAVAEHGPAALDALAEAFEAGWASSDSAGYWPADLRRSIVRSFYNSGKPVEWAAGRLEPLEAFMLEGQDIAGRISECQKQAEAWRAIGKTANARRLIDRGIQVSFGVGYRKDYQLDDWIGWLDRANAIDRAGAKQRILWFARALPTLKGVIEGRAVFSAGDELLKACFRWSPRRALSLFEFLVRHRLVRYEEALGTVVADVLVAGTLPSEIALHFVAEFLVPIARSGNQELASAVIRKTRAEGRDVIDAGRMLVSQARVFGLPSTRKRWLRGVALALHSMGGDRRQLGLTDDDMRPDSNDGEIGGLHLKDGSRLTEEEVSARVASTADIEGLILNESEDSYFNWTAILARVGGLVDRAAVERIAAGRGDRRRSAFGLATLSQLAARVGDSDQAWDLAVRSLDGSHEYGWARWVDGGSRLVALRALVRADRERGRALAFETLARDGGGGAGNLDEVLPLLTDDLPVLAIWREIEAHVEALFEGVELVREGLPDFDTDLADDTPSRAIAELIASHVSYPSLFVAQCAQRAAAKLLLRRTGAMRDAVRDGLGGPEDRQEQILSFLESVAKRDPTSVEMFRDAVTALYSSPNYLVRNSAIYIGTALGWGAPAARPPLALPPIYDFELPETRPDIVGGSPVSPS